MWIIQPRLATRDAESRKFWTSLEPAPASVQKIYRVFFSKHGLAAFSGAGDIHFLRLRLQFLAKRFGGFWSDQKLPVLAAPAATPAPHLCLPLSVG